MNSNLYSLREYWNKVIKNYFTVYDFNKKINENNILSDFERKASVINIDNISFALVDDIFVVTTQYEPLYYNLDESFVIPINFNITENNNCHREIMTLFRDIFNINKFFSKNYNLGISEFVGSITEVYKTKDAPSHEKIWSLVYVKKFNVILALRETDIPWFDTDLIYQIYV